MFPKLILILLSSLITSNLGIPLELEPEHDMKPYLSERIVGGIDAPPGYGAHMAALVWGVITTNLVCGGSIITTKHILTAAHCIDAMVIWGQLVPSFRGAIGSNKWASTEKTIRFKKYLNHADYSWQNIKYDIGILYLEKDIVLSHNVAIIPLSHKWVDGGTKSLVTGWGRLGANLPVSATLQLLYLYTISSKQCLERLTAVMEGWGPPPPFEPWQEICTAYTIGFGMCNGDSGSALVKNDTQEQIGIVSWGFPCARGAPDVFVRISAFLDWIAKALHTN